MPYWSFPRALNSAIELATASSSFVKVFSATELSLPSYTAIAFTVVVAVSSNGALYKLDVVVGTLLSVV